MDNNNKFIYDCKFCSSFLGVITYFISYIYLKFKVDKSNLIFSSNFNILIIHSLINFMDLIKYRNPIFYTLSIYLFNLFLYYNLTQISYKYITGSQFFSSDMEFNIPKFFLIFHVFFPIIIFPYLYFIDIKSISYMQITFLFTFFTIYYIVLSERIKTILNYLNEKEENNEIDFEILIDNMKPVHLRKVYSNFQNLIFICFSIILIIAMFKILIGIIDEHDSLYIYLNCITEVVIEIFYIIIFIFLVINLYLLNKKYYKESKPKENYDFVNLEIEEDDENNTNNYINNNTDIFNKNIINMNNEINVDEDNINENNNNIINNNQNYNIDNNDNDEDSDSETDSNENYNNYNNNINNNIKEDMNNEEKLDDSDIDTNDNINNLHILSKEDAKIKNDNKLDINNKNINMNNINKAINKNKSQFNEEEDKKIENWEENESNDEEEEENEYNINDINNKHNKKNNSLSSSDNEEDIKI
jgi:hypothetical protein